MDAHSETLSTAAIDLEKFKTIEDIPLTLYAELDRRTISFKELLELAPDTLLPLSRPAGENIDIYVGDVLIGSGEVLVVDSCLAVRVADLTDRPVRAYSNDGSTSQSSATE
jgi:flagellar motor switch protein FliN